MARAQHGPEDPSVRGHVVAPVAGEDEVGIVGRGDLGHLGDEIPDRVCHRRGGDGHVTPEVLDGGDSGFEVDVGERLGRSGLGDDVGLVGG